jgi:uncharacterized membrane protein
MADFPAPGSIPPSASVTETPTSAALLAYVLMAIGAVVALLSSGFPAVAPLMGLAGVAGVVVCYLKRRDARGTFVESHFRWLIGTFWYSLLWGVIGGIVLVVLGLILIGIPIAWLIWVAASIWVLYRIVRGYLLFNDRKPIPGK